MSRTSILGHLEGDLDVTLRAKVVHLGRANLGDDVHQIGAIAEITIVEFELVGTYNKVTEKDQIRYARSGARVARFDS